MRRNVLAILSMAVILIGATEVLSIEEISYTLLKKNGKFELRDYASHILAETVVDGNFEEAGKKAFNRLFRYISGDNRSRRKKSKTAPASQEEKGEKISMTAPVEQRPTQGRWAVSFMMPAFYTLETLPEPEDPLITLRQVPGRQMAAVRYSGFWSERSYQRNKRDLESWIDDQGFIIVGDPVWARYNSPFTLWFLRRNEILIPVDVKRESTESSEGKTVRIVFRLPGDDFGSPYHQEILHKIITSIRSKELGEILNSGFGMGTMEIAIKAGGDDSIRTIQRIIHDNYPEANYIIAKPGPSIN